MPLRDWVLDLFRRRPLTEEGAVRRRGQATHVIILDGTMSTLAAGRETNAGQAFKLLLESGHHANLTVYYEAGIQWRDWTETFGVVAGRGINRQIERAYGVLCSRWHPGDRIILLGYSRGAFAVRSLAGVVDRMGLVRQEHATARNIRQAYRYYTQGGQSPYARRFCALYCNKDARIAAIGAWDTVKSLGLRLPLLWRFEQKRHSYHSDGLVDCVDAAFHALAMDETREVFAPELWRRPAEWSGHLEQVWFRGTHGDVGGQIGTLSFARPLSNIPFLWMMARLEDRGLTLPLGWQHRFPTDPNAPSVGNWQGWGKLFLARRRRVIGRTSDERLHESVTDIQRTTRRRLVHRLGLG